MSLVPDHLILKNGLTQADMLQLPNGNLAISTTNILQLSGGAGTEVNVLLSVAGNDELDNPIKYSFPDVNIAMPEQDQIISFNSDGTSQFINNGGSGNPNSFINSQPSIVPPTGSILIADGAGSAFNAHPASGVYIDNDGLRLYGTGLQVVSVVGCDTRLTQSNDCNFNIQNNSAGKINLTCGGTVNINTSNGLIINNTASLVNTGDTLTLTSPNINLELGNLNINKADPKINFNNIDYPTQQCNISFQSANQELIIEHHSPDDAAKCNIRLGKNDINIQTGLIQPGDIKLLTGGSGQTYINDYKLPNINPTADGQLLSCNIDGESSWIDIPPASIAQNTYTYWVSNQGLDTNNGTIINPFQTIAYCLSVVNTLLQTDKVIINVMVGVYNEGALSITKNNITINGGTAIPSQTVVNAVITHTIDNTAGALIASSLYGLTVRGVVYAGSSVEDGSYVIGACILGTTESGIIPFVNSYSLAGSRDITVSNCVLNAYDTVGLTTVSGRINATATLFTQSFIQLSNLFPVLEATGNGLLALFGCQCFSTNNTNQAPPIISLANIVAPSSSHTFNSCTIQYIFSTVNVAPLNKVAIGCTNTVGISMLAYNNLILSEGTRITNSGSNYVIISKQGSGSLTITFGNNLCGATVHKYPTAASRTQLVTAVV